ncbi:MAG: LamG domain-containing protein [Clostridium sp.]|nr:LamG domain-containing protein [Clostridium sp.]
MKLRLYATNAALAALLLAGTSCVDEWGKADPPAGNQVYPTLQKAGETNFDEGLDPDVFAVVSSTAGVQPEVVEDAIAKSPVLQLNQGTVSFANPLTGLTCQKAASFTLWMQQPMDQDEEGNFIGEQDTENPVISFVNEASAAAQAAVRSRIEAEPYTNYGSLTFNSAGKIDYSTTDGTYSMYVPVDSLIPGGEWHYVAVTISDEGYAIAVDGEEKVKEAVADFDCMSIVEFLNNASTVTIGSLTTEQQLLVDDVNIYRNALTAKETKKPKKGNIGSGAEDDDSFYDPLFDGIFGPDDCNQGFWTIWSPSVNLTGNGQIHYEFTNYTLGNNNWENWVLVLTSSGLTPNDEDYAGADQELIVLRADAYGWGTYYDGATKESNYNWDTYKSDMDGANVKIDVYHNGDAVTIKSTTTTTGGTEYYWNVEFKGYKGETLGSFFTIENAQLKFNVDETFVGRYFESGSNILGNEDFSNGFWSCWSEQERFTEKFRNFGFEFINHSAGNGNYQFWNLVVTNGYQSGLGEDGYAEYLYIRDDAYGWASRWDAEKVTSSFNWDTFIADMQGARSRVMFRCDGDELLMVARQWKADGTEMPIYKFQNDGFALPLSLIFTCEGCWLDFVRIGYYPWCDLTTK